MKQYIVGIVGCGEVRNEKVEAETAKEAAVMW